MVGDHVLMYASDYPHGDSHLPVSVSLVVDWVMNAQRKRKLLWDRLLREGPRVRTPVPSAGGVCCELTFGGASHR